MFFNSVLPPIMGLSPVGMSVLCIFVGTILLLTAVDLMWPVLLCILAFATNDVYTLTEALQKSFGNHIFWFVAFVSIMLYVLREAGVLWRISTRLFKLKLVHTHPWLFLGCIFESILLIGCLLEPATLTLVYLALFEVVFEQLHIRKGDRFAELIVMGVLIFAGMSYGITPLAHPVAMVAVEVFAPLYNVGMAEYTVVGVLLGTCVVVLYMLMLRYVFRMDISVLRNFDASALETGKTMSRSEKIVSLVYIVVILLWLAPTVLSGIAPQAAELLGQFGVVGPAMAGTVVLCMVQYRGKPRAEMTEMLKKAVPWTCCLPVAASMLLGSALTSEEVGMAHAISTTLEPLLSGMSVPVFMVALAVFCSLFTDFTSNAISAMMTSTLCMVFIQSGLLPDLHPGAMAIVLGFSANLAFMYPAGSTYAAITSGSGWVRTSEQMKLGFIYSILPALLACTVGYGLACIILP